MTRDQKVAARQVPMQRSAPEQHWPDMGQKLVPAGHEPQRPSTHAATPVAEEQRTLQPPQLFTSVRTSTQARPQRTPLSSPPQKIPIAHVGVLPAEDAQTPSAAQLLPHAPQLLLLIASVSQPVLNERSQSKRPGSHVILHSPATHATRPPETFVGQARPHAPQLLMSLCVLVSQPVAILLSQSEKPAAHVMLHTPPTHVGAPLGPPEQPVPHPPQLRGSVLGSMHPPPQLSCVPVQPVTQVEPEHTGVGFEQPRPHAPQFVEEVVVLVSQPLTDMPSQLAKPGMHVVPQVPPVHVGVAPGSGGQALPQDAQFAMVPSATSQPLSGSSSQLAKPTAQARPHAPIEHVAVELGPEGQTREHAPQLRGLFVTFTHCSSQLVSDGGHATPTSAVTASVPITLASSSATLSSATTSMGGTASGPMTVASSGAPSMELTSAAESIAMTDESATTIGRTNRGSPVSEQPASAARESEARATVRIEQVSFRECRSATRNVLPASVRLSKPPG